jgi:hypothetical protein
LSSPVPASDEFLRGLSGVLPPQWKSVGLSLEVGRVQQLMWWWDALEVDRLVLDISKSMLCFQWVRFLGTWHWVVVCVRRHVHL